MKKFLIGLAVGIILGVTGVYAIVREKIQKVATIENAEKVADSAKELGKTIKDVFD